jgi:predicted membrane protein
MARARALSLLLAVAVSTGLMLLPAMRGGELTRAGHGLLSPLIILVCALFVHGLGYSPARPGLQRLLSPWLLWPLTLILAALWWQLSANG